MMSDLKKKKKFIKPRYLSSILQCLLFFQIKTLHFSLYSKYNFENFASDRNTTLPVLL